MQFLLNLLVNFFRMTSQYQQDGLQILSLQVTTMIGQANKKLRSCPGLEGHFR